MEQLTNMMLANVQIPQAAPAAKNGGSVQGDGFQKLLEQKADAPAEPKREVPEAAGKAQEVQSTQEAPSAEKVVQEEPVEGIVTDGKELEEQMLLAAMAMMQNPVVPVEQVMTPEEAPVIEAAVVVEDIAPIAVEAVVEPEAGVLAPETEQPVMEVPVEEGQTVDQSLAEEVPQPVEAPEAAEETEGRTVEVKTGEARPQAERVEKPVEETTEEPVEETVEVQEGEAPVFEEVKAVPVKVGEAPKAEAPKPMEEQIAPKVAHALQNGETHVEIQLNPENLGKVTVEMTWSKDGNLVVQLHAENRETQNLLSKNTSGLEALLGREAAQEVRVEVPREEESQRQRDLYEQQQNQNKQQQERQEHRRSRQSDSENFLQQLRLGLVPMDGEE